MKDVTYVAILGCGTVGGGASRGTDKMRGASSAATEAKKVEIKVYSLDLRGSGDPLGDRVVHDFSVIENDPEISIVLEMMGGIHPACDFSRCTARGQERRHLKQGRSRALRCGNTFSIAAENKVRYLYEASVGGGIPILNPLIHCITGQNTVTEINGILQRHKTTS